MNLEYYLSILIKRWKLILICIAVIGLGAYIGSKLVTPIYQSTVLIQVTIHTSTTSADYNNLLASDQLVQTEAQLATSNSVLHEVATYFPALTADQLAGETVATPKLNTQLFAIDVQDASPTRAAALANSIASTLIKQQVQGTQQDNNRSQQQLQQEVDTAQQSIAATSSKITSLQIQAANLEAKKGTQIQVADLRRRVADLQNQLYSLQDHRSQWQATLVQIELAAAQGENFLHIAQSALPATRPVRPSILLNTVVGLAAGLFIGLILALLFEQLDTRIHTVEDLTRLLSWPILGTVWFVDSSKKKKEDLIDPQERSTNIESYRILRTNIGFSAVNNPIRTLVVTSALPNDGKSTIASNLAIFMAKAGKNTLLIDADLRHPTVHKKFFLTADNVGLSNAIIAFSQPSSHTSSLSDMATPSDVSLNDYMYSVDIPNLRVMPAGTLPPNPPELLDSKAMSHLLTALTSSEIEMIIFDTPPLLSLSDTSILAPKTDGALIVVDITRANRKNLQHVKALFTQAGTRVLGYVINKQSYSRRNMAYAPYSYYSTEENKEEKVDNVSSI